MRFEIRLCLPLVMLVGCGGTSQQGPGAAGSTGDGGGGAAQAGSSAKAGAGAGGSGSGGASTSSCPNEPPRSGSSCTVVGSALGFAGAQCSWGDDRRPACRISALCSNGSWSVTQPPVYCSEAEPLPEACPETSQAAAGECDDPTLACWYDNGTICRCSPCMGGSEYPICQTIDPPQWACTTPDAACPNPMPQAGDSCDHGPELTCGPNCELPIRCRDGAWQYDQAMCPICAAPNTPIATPQGERPISDLAPGDLVYSVDATGIVVVPILRVGSTPVVNHRVVRVELTGGKVLEISAGHPTADGRTFADLLGGGTLDRDHAVVSAEVVPYAHPRTYDILPSSSSGMYFAGGALIGSTLATPPR
jgi:hypothetical protein